MPARALHLLACLLVCLPAATVAVAQDVEPIEFPDTAHGELCRRLFETFEVGGETARRFMEDYRTPEALARRPMEERLAQYEEMRASIGVLTPARYQEDGDQITVVAFSAQMQSWLQLVIGVVDGKMDTISIQPSGPPRDEPFFREWTDLNDLLAQCVASSGVPAMAAAWIRDGQIVDVGVAGLREAGGDDPVQLEDPFHIGSATKSITATAVASLVQDGTLSWDLTLGEALGAIPMKDVYRDVTLRQLADHLGGIQPYTNLTAADDARFGSLPGVGGQQRAGFVKAVLQQEPVSQPGTSMQYSNAGFTLLGHVAERRARRSWEKLLRERVFTPLGLTSAHFGWPSGANRPAAPRGHFGTPPNLRAREDGEYELGDYLDPAGDVSMSARDLARFAQTHLRGLRGEDGLLKPATIQELHRLPEGERDGYAGGWVIEVTDDDQALHWHNGSTGTYFALMQIVPDRNWGVVILINAGGPANLLDEVAATVYAKSLQP